MKLVLVAFVALYPFVTPGLARAEQTSAAPAVAVEPADFEPDEPEPADPEASDELDGRAEPSAAAAPVRSAGAQGEASAGADTAPSTAAPDASAEEAPEAGIEAAPGMIAAPEVVDLNKPEGKRAAGEEAVNDLFRGASEPEPDSLGSFEDILGEPSDSDADALPDEPPFDLLKKSPQVQGLAAHYRVIAAAEGDLDGDGLREYVVAFGPGSRGRAGGFAIVAFRAGKFGLAWAGLYERSAPEDVAVESSRIRATVRTPQGLVPVVLEHGEDFRLRDDGYEPFKDAKLRVSSRVRGVRAKELAAEHLIDGDYHTVWCTETVGTGVGEWIELELAGPMDLGLVGVIGGDFRSDERWRESNRLFRYELVAETKADRTTLVEEMDLTRMLKLPTIGKRVSSTADDAMRTSWSEVAHRAVVGLKLETASVYFGAQNDELCVAEIELGFLLPEPKRPPPPAVPVAAPSAPGAKSSERAAPASAPAGRE
ncbi:MAG: NADase-type glycan-binding domain-containing protein [Myxococcales bacterium]